MGQKLQQHGTSTVAAAVEKDTEKYGRGVTDEAADNPARASHIVVCFYKFADLRAYEEMRTPSKELWVRHRVCSGIIWAHQGINGSICGTRQSLEYVFPAVQSDVRRKDLRRIEAPTTSEEEDLHLGQTQISPLGPGGGAPFGCDLVRVKVKIEVHHLEREISDYLEGIL